MKPAHVLTTIVAAILAVSTVVTAKVNVKTQFDKTFDFKGLRTFEWHPDGAGDVKLLHLSGDDPARLRKDFEPVIVQATEQELAKKGFSKATSGQPDLNIYYYVLIGANTEAQVAGQFLAPVPAWGIAPFSPSTTSLEVYEQGTLILDLSAPSIKSMVWRGSAAARIDRQNSDAKRNEIIRGAIQDMFKKFPPKK